MASDAVPLSSHTPGTPESYVDMAGASAHAERAGRGIAVRLVKEGLSRHEAQAVLAFARANLDCWFDQIQKGKSHG